MSSNLRILHWKELPEAVTCRPQLLEEQEIMGVRELLGNNGAGIHAVQAGISSNYFLIKDDPAVYCNCKYSDAGAGKILSEESCLSIPWEDSIPHPTLFPVFPITRYKEIILEGEKLLFVRGKRKITGISLHIAYPLSIVMQHETDHGMGILINRESYVF